MNDEVTFGSVCLHLDRHSDWQKSLTYEKKQHRDPNSEQAVQRRQEVEENQARLIGAVEAGPEAARDYLLHEALGVDDAALARLAMPSLPRLTPGEMSRLPIHAEREVARALDGQITPAHAAEPAVWALCHAVWISDGVFGADLAAVFLDGPRANTSEARTRNFLRRTGGLRHVRGNTSPLDDCPVSAAWWRRHIAREVASVVAAETSVSSELDADTAHKVLHNREIWSNLVTMSLRQVTAVCAPRARAALVTALHNHGATVSGSKAARALTQGAIRALGRLSHSHNLTETPWQHLVDTATEGLDSTSAVTGI